MSGFEDKFDSGLWRIYRAYLRRRAEPDAGHRPAGRAAGPAPGRRVGEPPDLPVPDDGRLNISIQYTGELAAIEALGFTTLVRRRPGRATGTVDLGRIDALGNSPAVLAMRFGEPKSPTLDESVPDVLANSVWTVTGGVFSGFTGKGVLIGVIDTGIDWRHDFFRSAEDPMTTRIVKIWDQGLVPQGAEVTPFAGLVGAPDYGVEYGYADINANLQKLAGAIDIRHFDCIGHGTHVASIAAGNGRGPYTHIGVAPEADLAIVKHLDLQATPTYASPPNGPVPPTDVYRDAIEYLRLLAADRGQTLVINISLGSDLGPHDGFTDDEDYLTQTFPPTTVGEICVLAAGNSGAKRQHARIDFTAAGTVDVPLELFDERGAKKLAYRGCTMKPGTVAAGVEVWYPDGATLTGAVQLPGGTTFETTSGVLDGRTYNMIDGNQDQVLDNGLGVVLRRRFSFVIEPHVNRHVLGPYTLRLSASGPMTAHLWCRHGRGEGMRVADVPLPGGVHHEDTSLIGPDAGAANVVTVTAYTAEVATDEMAGFSSSGPLVSYGPLPVPQPAKPDIAAPGASVDAAKSRSAKPWRPGLTTSMNGTSMSAPHVAGAIALMLQKNSNLTIAQIIATLRANARTTPPTTPDQAGAGRLDVKAAVDNAP